MAKIKHTKNELKAQREALARFQRFLPMLVLKKQQLQAEIQIIENEMEKNAAAEALLTKQMNEWIGLFSEQVGIEDLIRVSEIRTGESNIAGVNIPVFEDVVFASVQPDFFDTPPWVDAGLDALEKLLRLRVHLRTLEEQRRLIAEELRVTSQRVNLFEIVKIPEAKEHIRIIRIFLGDEQTAAVARGKLAKARTLKYQYDDEAA